MERYLEDRVAIVTGGAGGIGSELVKALVAAGAAVVVNDAGVTIDGRDPSPEPATTLVEKIETAGGRAIAHTGSVADHDVAGALVALAVKAYGRVDVLVTCHGIFSEGSIFDLAVGDCVKLRADRVSNRANLSIANFDLVNRADRGYLRRCSAEEYLIGQIQQLARNSLFMKRDTQVLRNMNHRVACDSWKYAVGERWGVKAIFVNEEDVLARAFADVTVHV